MYAHLAKLIITYRRPILALFALIVFLGFSRLPDLQFDFTPQQLFKSATGVVDERERFADTFGREDNLIFVLAESKDVFAPAELTYLRDLTTEARQISNVKSADSIVTMEIPRQGDSPGDLATEPICEPSGEVSAESAKRLADLVDTEPLVRSRVVSEDKTTTVVLIWLDDHVQDVKLIRQAVLNLESLIAARPPPPGLTLELAGIPHFRQEIVESLKYEQMVFIPITGFAYVFILFLLFRRFSGVVLPMMVVGITCAITLGIMVASGSPINIINNILPSLIFIIAVSDSIHMLVRDAEETEAGATRVAAITEMVRHTGVACLLTSTTTAVGFFSLLTADTEILKDLGWQAGGAVLIAYLVTVLFLPAALISVKPVRREAFKPGSKGPYLERILARVGSHLLDHPWTYMLGSLAIAGVAAWLASGVVIDTVLMEVYDEEHPTFQRMRLIEEKLGGVLPLEIMLEAEEQDAFKSPELFAKVNGIQKFVGEDPIAVSTQSLVDFHQAARVALLGSEAERTQMPDSREQIEQIQMMIQGPPDSKLGPNRFITSDFSKARILVRVADAGARQQLRLGDKLKEHLKSEFPPGSGVRYSVTGDAYIASLSLHSFITDLFHSLLLAILIIFGMMTFVFRSLKLGLVSVLPNTIPLLLTFGYMGLMGIDLNTTTIITFAISLGLAVDDTIHFVARFQEELKTTHDVRDAVLKAFAGAGRAIMLTSIMLLVGLSVLLLSDFVPTRMFGTLTGITIFGAIFGDLVLLPTMLYLAFRNDKDPKPTMEV